jgi:hypothetical protein
VTERQAPPEAGAVEFCVYATGPACCSVCSSLSIEETTKRLNRENPSGLGPWQPSKDATFSGGEPQPSPCERSPATHKHYLFNC